MATHSCKKKEKEKKRNDLAEEWKFIAWLKRIRRNNSNKSSEGRRSFCSLQGRIRLFRLESIQPTHSHRLATLNQFFWPNRNQWLDHVPIPNMKCSQESWHYSLGSGGTNWRTFFRPPLKFTSRDFQTHSARARFAQVHFIMQMSLINHPHFSLVDDYRGWTDEMKQT